MTDALIKLTPNALTGAAAALSSALARNPDLKVNLTLLNDRYFSLKLAAVLGDGTLIGSRPGFDSETLIVPFHAIATMEFTNA